VLCCLEMRAICDSRVLKWVIVLPDDSDTLVALPV